MPRWRPLPDVLDDDTRLLVERLRTLKEQAGLSLVELAARTSYSKSAWHRYLNGDKFPPRQAVEALGRVAGAEPESLVSLWGRAHHACNQPELQTVAPPQVTEPVRRINWFKTAVVLAASCAILGAAAVAGEVMSAAADTAGVEMASCRGATCQGRIPHSSRCTQDARTESAVTAGAYVVRLRYSPSCAAVWAEVHTHAGGAVSEVSIKAGPDTRLTSHPVGNADGSSSPMLRASERRTEEACAVAGGKLACTSKDGSEVVPAPGWSPQPSAMPVQA
ncbi:helix-turn-helix domain-containing protein [Streptomyces sp. NBC_00239]|uniref:helix-turn-helix domain-containing protein n=1 Tax=Streptomyces sp. NBC_00239 TaxID=2903640 RepID=UPI002E2A10BB|nr:DUF2690 domain-containing protein [Streptomyces sp. NBC_00239]